MYKPYHLIGLELNISILSAALRGEPTGQPHGFRGDVAAVAKRNLRAGEMLDGEGGYTVWGKLVPAAASLKAGALPIGLAHRVKLKHDVAHGEIVRWSDVEFDANNETIKTRKVMEAAFAKRGRPKPEWTSPPEGCSLRTFHYFPYRRASTDSENAGRHCLRLRSTR